MKKKMYLQTLSILVDLILIGFLSIGPKLQSSQISELIMLAGMLSLALSFFSPKNQFRVILTTIAGIIIAYGLFAFFMSGRIPG